MAIIDSILVGKGRGKIGNVVLSVNKGQTIAKQLNSAPANPRSAGQTSSRNQMANAVAGYQALSLFLMFAGALRKPLESIFNAVVRLVKTSLSTSAVVSRGAAALDILDTQTLLGNWILIDAVNVVGDDANVLFTTGGLPFVAGTHVRYVSYTGNYEAPVIIDRVVTTQEWTAQELTIFDGAISGNGRSVYFYTPDQSKVSSVFF